MRNERSSLIILSYVIGFTTAFILFLDNSNLTNSYSEEIVIKSTETENPLENKSFVLKSIDNNYIFFCENNHVDSNFCDAFIYDTNKNTIISLLVDGEKMKISNDLLNTLKWGDSDSLIFSENYSVSLATNWNLLTDVYSLDIR